MTGNPMPFTRLETGIYLHGRPEKDTYKLLIEAYRLPLDDVAEFEGVVDPDSVYASATNYPPALVPAVPRRGERCCRRAPAALVEADKQGVQGLRNEQRRRRWLDLRMLAEAVYGRGTGGQDGSAMRRTVAMREAEAAARYMSLFDASRYM
ncbi:hypothetical protein DL769_010248 [Monosporascus sp. CRB-8-3]|nr:hypothetical protein DL769_010248 [Monosporascus sp. CRB-8-3]